MKLNFTNKQQELLQALSLSFDVNGDLSDDQINEIDDKVSDHFAHHGIEKDDQVNNVGLVCESIMDILGEL